MHHLKELVSIVGLINPTTLIVVDDCAMVCRAVPDAQNNLSLISQPMISGKGLYVAEYAAQIKATLAFAHYQVGWTGFVQ